MTRWSNLSGLVFPPCDGRGGVAGRLAAGEVGIRPIKVSLCCEGVTCLHACLSVSKPSFLSCHVLYFIKMYKTTPDGDVVASGDVA